MIKNETINSIIARRSHKYFNGRPIGQDEVETVAASFFGYPLGEPKDRGPRRNSYNIIIQNF